MGKVSGQFETRRRRYGSRKRSRYDRRSAGTSVRRTRNRRATRVYCSRLPKSMHARLQVHLNNCYASSPQPTPTHCRAHHTTQTRSMGNCRPVEPFPDKHLCVSNRRYSYHRNSPDQSKSLTRSEMDRSSPLVQHTPTRIPKATGIGDQSSCSAMQHKPWHRSS